MIPKPLSQVDYHVVIETVKIIMTLSTMSIVSTKVSLSNMMLKRRWQ